MRGAHRPGHRDPLPVLHVRDVPELMAHPPAQVVRYPRVPDLVSFASPRSLVLVEVNLVVVEFLLRGVPLVVPAFVVGVDAERHGIPRILVAVRVEGRAIHTRLKGCVGCVVVTGCVVFLAFIALSAK